MFIFYNVNPEHVYFHKAYIMKVFKDKVYESQCITTVSFYIFLISQCYNTSTGNPYSIRVSRFICSEKMGLK